MTAAYDDLKSVGSGVLAYRISIEGLGYGGVTKYEMETATRLIGLNMRSVKFKSSIDPVSGKLTVDGFSVGLADINQQWSAIFAKQPTNYAWLAADCTDIASTIDVATTTGWPTAGTLWLDSEAITYTGKTGTSFTGCTRGALNTTATYHYISDGANKRTPELTDWPVIWEGRRLNVYVYTRGDDYQGDGTLIYRGVISTSPQTNGVQWSIGVASIYTLFNATLGGTYTEPFKPRGIYYPKQRRLNLTIYQSSNQTITPVGAGTAAIILGSDGQPGLFGFWETQEAFCISLTAAIQAAFTAASFLTTNVMRAVPMGTNGYYIELNTPVGANARSYSMEGPSSLVDAGFGSEAKGPQYITDVSDSLWAGSQVANVGTSGGQYGYFSPVYTAEISGGRTILNSSTRPKGADGAGTVPRGIFGSAGDISSRRIYLASDAALPSIATAVSIEFQAISGWAIPQDAFTFESTIDDIDTSGASIDAVTYASDDRGPWYFTKNFLPIVRMGLSITTNSSGVNLSQMLNRITTQVPQNFTLGVVPNLRTEDYAEPEWLELFDSGAPRFGLKRLYKIFNPIVLNDYVVPDLKLCGYILGLNSEGCPVPKRLRLPANSELGDVPHIGVAKLLTDKSMLSTELNGLGLINTVIIQTGYNPRTDKFDTDDATKFIIKDVASFGRGTASRPYQIASKSEYPQQYGAPSNDEMIRISAAVFGTLGGAYTIDTIDLGASFDVNIGDVIVYDQPHRPNSEGAIGSTNVVGFVLAREAESYSPRVRLTCITANTKLGGYAPGAPFGDFEDNGGGSYNLLLSGGSPDLPYPADTTSRDWFKVGDAIVIRGIGGLTDGERKGVVTGYVYDDFSLVVQLTGGGMPTATAGFWYVTIVDSNNTTPASLAENQKRFAHIANENKIVTYNGTTAPAFKLGA